MALTKGLRWFFAHAGKLKQPAKYAARVARPLADDAIRLGVRVLSRNKSVRQALKSAGRAYNAGSRFGKKGAHRFLLGKKAKRAPVLRRVLFNLGRPEHGMKPTLRNSTKIGKLAFRGEIGASALAIGGATWAANSYRKEVATFKKQSAERDKALEVFKRSLKVPTIKRVRRIK